ncbi:hypothetical protein [Sinorhizobium meliloti]|uniref:hypothetical protein n=1 Tax=Rhizobium meliloti TaxID=382 RepID=UPI0013E2E77C|nr:hypothetical protein [Sinorhizobium meliloti]
MFGLLDWMKFAAGAAMGAALIVAPAYVKGKAAGREQAGCRSLPGHSFPQSPGAAPCLCRR